MQRFLLDSYHFSPRSVATEYAFAEQEALREKLLERVKRTNALLAEVKDTFTRREKA